MVRSLMACSLLASGMARLVTQPMYVESRGDAAGTDAIGPGIEVFFRPRPCRGCEGRGRALRRDAVLGRLMRRNFAAPPKSHSSSRASAR